jgi:hypothetical protein
MADNVEQSVEEKVAREQVRVEQTIDNLVSQMPHEIVLVQEDGTPFEGDEDMAIVLDEVTKYNLALMMLATGEDFETCVNNTIKHGIEWFDDGVDSDEEE